MATLKTEQVDCDICGSEFTFNDRNQKAIKTLAYVKQDNDDLVKRNKRISYKYICPECSTWILATINALADVNDRRRKREKLKQIAKSTELAKAVNKQDNKATQSNG